VKAVITALCLAASGCATTWAFSQAAGKPQIWDEGARDVSVPSPGVAERFTIELPLVTQYEPPPTSTAGQPPPAPKPIPFALSCSVDQDARDTVYHAAFRYGHVWKKGTAIAFLVEGAIASSIFLLASSDQQAEAIGYGGFFALDAIASGALFFAPRKEIYRHDQKAVTTHVRSDCPEGLELQIGGTSFPVDAAGHLGELGHAALDEWMAAPRDAIEVRVAGQARELPVGGAERCAWQRDHHRLPCTAMGMARTATVTIPVAAGTLARRD
jgi:hypothetical protein